MRTDILELDVALAQRVLDRELSLQDVEAIRLLLTGGSVVDWQRLGLRDLEQVDQFLRLHGLNMQTPYGHERLRYVFNEAVSYLEEHLKLQFPAELRAPADVRQIFLWASDTSAFRRTQILSCVILKLMHVLQHLEAADLRFRTPVSEADLLQTAQTRILAAAREMRDAGIPVVSFYGNRKSRSSVLTKLIAKRENVAATIFDKLRFRLVVETEADLPVAIAWMTRHLFPFNYVIPDQSHNNLLDPAVLRGMLRAEERDLPAPNPIDAPPPTQTGKNQFSGSTYRMINFIIDFPVPISVSSDTSFSFELGNVVYVLVEFQVVDAATAATNERGENAHFLYKERQHDQVARRLKRGRFVKTN